MHSQDDVPRFQRRLIVSWTMMAALAALLLMPHVRRWMDSRVTGGDPRPVTPRGNLADFEKTSVELFRLASPSVVFINTTARVANLWTRRTYEVEAGTGSGFIWDKHGHIVTNFHVIKDASSYQVEFADKSFQAELIDSSPDDDLAVLKIETSSELLKPVSIGTSSDLMVGQSVFAIGHPYRLGLTYTTGVVSARSRSIKGPSGRPIDDVIQIDAAINPGNSGGPLLDSAGRLIGVNTAIYSPSGASAGIGFAIPVDTVNRVVPAIIANGRYEPPRIGIGVSPELNDVFAQRTGLKAIVIDSVEPGGPAEAAGLRGARLEERRIIVGDVILKVSNQRVTTLNELLAALGNHERGERVTLTILREGIEQTVDVTLK